MGSSRPTMKAKLKKRNSKITLALFAVLFAGIGGYFIINSFAATGSCTQTLAEGVGASTIQSTLENASIGSVICLPGGSYGDISLNKNRQGYVTLQSLAGRTAILGNIYLSQASNYFRFESLTTGSIQSHSQITSGTSTGNIQVVNSDVGAVSAFSGTHDWLVENNDITQCTDQCVEFNTSDSYMPSQHNVIRGNKFVGPNAEDMIRIGNFRDILIEGNQFIDNFEHSVPVTQSSDKTCHCDVLQGIWSGSDLVIRGNSITNGTGQGFFIKDARDPRTGIVGPHGLGVFQNVTIENNLVVNNKDDADSPAQTFSWGKSALTPIGLNEADNVRIFNNTVWDNDSATIIAEGVTNAVVKNNIFQRFQVANNSTATSDYNLSPSFETTSGGVMIKGGHDLNGSPTFAYSNNGSDLNSANWNYRLASNSLGIDTGTNTSGVSGYSVPAFDKEGKNRVDISAVLNGSAGFYDIGAYEFQSTTTPTCTKQPDINCDNVVNITDLSILLSSYGKTTAQLAGSTPSYPKADINTSGKVDIADLSALLTGYGK